MLRKKEIETSEGTIIVQEIGFKKMLELLSMEDQKLIDIYHAYIPLEEDWAKLDKLNSEDAKKIMRVIEEFRSGENKNPNHETP